MPDPSTSEQPSEYDDTIGAGSPTPVRVLIVDDHDLFRTGLAAMLYAEPGVEVVGQASRGGMGIRLARELRPHVVLMDLRMPDVDGITATREILSTNPEIRIITLTVSDEGGAVEGAVLAGAQGYLLKDAPAQDIVAAVHSAAGGSAWLSPLAANTVLAKVRRDHVEPRGPSEPDRVLSHRELDVLRLVARGLDNARIAQELHISPRTAKNHVSSVLAKLGLANRVEAAIYAVRQGLD